MEAEDGESCVSCIRGGEVGWNGGSDELGGIATVASGALLEEEDAVEAATEWHVKLVNRADGSRSYITHAVLSVRHFWSLHYQAVSACDAVVASVFLRCSSVPCSGRR